MIYEFDGKQYEKASAHQTIWGEEMVMLLTLRGAEAVLDIGCGDGRVTQKIALRVPDGEVLGIDASDSMIAAAKKYESANLHFGVISVNDLSFQERFDVVFSHAALHWVGNHRLILKKIYEGLRTGGYARLNFASEGAIPTLIQIIRETMCHTSYAKYFSEFVWPWYMPNLTEYQEIISQSSFREAQIIEERKERLFPSGDSLIKWIDQPCLVPFLAAIGDENKQVFRDIVIDQMLHRTRQAQGGFLEQFHRLDILIRK